MKKTEKFVLLNLALFAGCLAACESGSNNGVSSEDPVSSSEPVSSQEVTSSEVTSSEVTSTQTTSSEGDEPLFKDEVSIVWKSTLSYTDAIQHLIDDFHALYPQVNVEYSKVSGNYDTLKDNIISGIGASNLPNVVSCYPDHVAEYINYNIVVNLSTYMNAEGKPYAWTEDDYDDMLPSLLEPCSTFARKGTFMLPQSSSTEAMFYNENILGKVFGSANDGKPITVEYLNNITWEELLDVLAPAILDYNASHDNCFLDVGDDKPSAVVNYSGADNAFVTFCAEQEVEFSAVNKSTGGGKILFNDNRTMKDVLKKFNGYYKDNLFSTAGIEGETNINVNEKLYSVFATGSTGGIKYQIPGDGSFGTGVMRIPNFEGHPHKVISQGPGVCVLKSGNEDQDLAAYLFIDFINKAENTLYWALETGYFPVRSSCYETEAYIEACEETGKTPASLELLKAKTYTYANSVQGDFFTNAAFKGSSSARTLSGSLFNTVVGSTDEVTDTFLDEQFANTVNEILNKMA